MDFMVQEPNDNVAGFDALPNEIMLKIFAHLTQNKLGEIAKVCRRWNVLTRTPALWKKVNVEFSPSHVCQTTVAQNFIDLLPDCVTHMKLDFMYRDDWTERLNFEELSTGLQGRCPQLEMLIFDRAILSNTLSSVIDSCDRVSQKVNVLVLHYAEFPGVPETRECGKSSNIQVLDLFGSFLGCNVEDNYDILSIPSLKVLRLARTDIDNTWLQHNASVLPQLQVLDIGFTDVDTGAFQLIKNLAINLSELYLCWLYLNKGDISGTMFHHLKIICIRSCVGVNYNDVVYLIRSCSSLETIYVDEGIANEYRKRTFSAENKCKSNIVKTLNSCLEHQKMNYLCD